MKHPIKYTEEEKQLFVDYLVYKEENCKQNFAAYLEQFISLYGQPIAPELFIELPVTHKDNIFSQLKNFKYDTSHVLWGNDNNDNLVTFMLSHPDFDASNSRLKDLNSVRPNWNHQDKNGNTALHLLALNAKRTTIQRVQEHFPINVNAKNKNEDYFTFLLLKPTFTFRNKHQIDDELITLLYYIPSIYEVITQHPKHFERASTTKIQEISDNYHKLKELIIAKIEENGGNQNQHGIKYLQEKTQPMDYFINHFLMNKKISNTQKEKPKMKI